MNTAVGSQSLKETINGHNNTAIGYATLTSNNIDGWANNAFGTYALTNNEEETLILPLVIRHFTGT
ncbi:MAG: hypothetical protein H6613_18470 [Ignavibacteriales bacterium]|nr:hypothetical protein [Ignavibacteriales bacterium]